MNRRVITYMLLCTSLVVIVAAQISFRRPSMWRWLQPAPATAPVAGSTADSDVAGSQQTPSAQRRAPYPIQDTLAGAADLEPFLAPVENAIPELQASAKANLDANARYHLLALAKDAPPGALEADAQADIRYQALLQKTSDYRGTLIRIAGDLISLSEPMELHRKVPGMEICYLALMTNERTDHQFLVLFTDLPAGIPRDQSRWNQLYLRQVQFSGYFYKVAKFIDPKNKNRQWMLPVLVGKSPLLPEMVEETNWLNLVTLFLLMAIPVGLVLLLLPRWFRKTDSAHHSLMERFRQRREEWTKQTLKDLPGKDNPPLRLDHDEG